MLVHGAEHCRGEPSRQEQQQAASSTTSSAPADTSAAGGSSSSTAAPTHASSHPPPGTLQRVTAALLYLALWLLALVALSDLYLRDMPADQCLPKLPALLRELRSSIRLLSTFPFLDLHTWDMQLPSCWASQTWGFILLVKDYTPNIGLYWYFFLEMFLNFTPFFKFVFHSHAVIMALPLAIRLGHRPFLLLWCQLLISCLFKAYPSVGDLVPYLTLLPLLHEQLQHMKLKLFLLNAFLLLAVLGPAMFHQWIELDAANSNYFYSITLGIAVWQILLLAQMLVATIRVDRIKAGKDGVSGDEKAKAE